jgi:hypothetical protein
MYFTTHYALPSFGYALSDGTTGLKSQCGAFFGLQVLGRAQRRMDGGVEAALGVDRRRPVWRRELASALAIALGGSENYHLKLCDHPRWRQFFFPAMWRAILRARGLSMAWRPRLVSMPSISMIWRCRPTSSARWTLSGFRRGRACGRTLSAKRRSPRVEPEADAGWSPPLASPVSFRRATQTYKAGWSRPSRATRKQNCHELWLAVNAKSELAIGNVTAILMTNTGVHATHFFKKG